MEFLDNRDMRDRYYQGPFIIEFDGRNGREPQTKEEAETVIRKILINDEIQLSSILIKAKEAEKKWSETKKELRFKDFIRKEFNNIVVNALENNVKITSRISNNEFLGLDEYKKFYSMVLKDYLDNYPLYLSGGYCHFGYDELMEIYNQLNKLIGCMMEPNNKKGPYKGSEEIETALMSCRNRIKELEECIL